MVHESVQIHNNESSGSSKYRISDNPINDNPDFAAAVTELHTLLCETVTCAPGVAGVMWARYHDARERHGVAAAIEALNRFVVTQKPGAA